MLALSCFYSDTVSVLIDFSDDMLFAVNYPNDVSFSLTGHEWQLMNYTSTFYVDNGALRCSIVLVVPVWACRYFWYVLLLQGDATLHCLTIMCFTPLY